MKTCLTIIHPREFAGLPPERVDDALKGFDAVSVKLLDGAHKLTDGTVTAFIRKLRTLGVEPWGWGWVNARNEKEALLEARVAAQVCDLLDIRVWVVNCEKTWAGVDGAPRTADPYGMLDTYVTEFYRLAPKTHLVYNGFSWGTTSRATGARRLHDAALMGRFWAYCPMCYGTDRRTVAQSWLPKVRRYKAAVSTTMVMPGCGRIDADGKVWGHWYDDARTGTPGTRSLLIQSRPAWVCFFFGNGAKQQLLTGHALHPALTQCVREIRDLKI